MRTKIAALAMMAFASMAWAGTEISERADAHPRGQVEVSNVSGSVVVTGWDREQVELTGTLGKGSKGLIFEPQGERTLIKVELPRSSDDVQGSDLKVMVPRGSRVTVTAVSADVDVRNVLGALRIQSVSGDLDLEVFEEDVEAKTVSGDLKIRGHDQQALVTVTSVSGDGEVTGIRGELVAQSVTGNLEVEGREMSRSRLRTTNGDIDLEFSFAPGARLDMEAINGDLHLDILGEINAEFDIETFNGSIDNSFGPEPVRTSKYTPGRDLRFTAGDGDARIRIKTLNGGITLRDN
jgi:hypothetical protein